MRLSNKGRNVPSRLAGMTEIEETKRMRYQGLEPWSLRWQRRIIPLNQYRDEDLQMCEYIMRKDFTGRMTEQDEEIQFCDLDDQVLTGLDQSYPPYLWPL